MPEGDGLGLDHERDQRAGLDRAAQRGLYLGVPVMLGKGGVERVFELELTTGERAMLAESVRLCSESIEEARKLLLVAA